MSGPVFAQKKPEGEEKEITMDTIKEEMIKIGQADTFQLFAWLLNTNPEKAREFLKSAGFTFLTKTSKKADIDETGRLTLSGFNKLFSLLTDKKTEFYRKLHEFYLQKARKYTKSEEEAKKIAQKAMDSIPDVMEAFAAMGATMKRKDTNLLLSTLYFLPEFIILRERETKEISFTKKEDQQKFDSFSLAEFSLKVLASIREREDKAFERVLGGVQQDLGKVVPKKIVPAYLEQTRFLAVLTVVSTMDYENKNSYQECATGFVNDVQNKNPKTEEEVRNIAEDNKKKHLNEEQRKNLGIAETKIRTIEEEARIERTTAKSLEEIHGRDSFNYRLYLAAMEMNKILFTNYFLAYDMDMKFYLQMRESMAKMEETLMKAEKSFDEEKFKTLLAQKLKEYGFDRETINSLVTNSMKAIHGDPASLGENTIDITPATVMAFSYAVNGSVIG